MESTDTTYKSPHQVQKDKIIRADERLDSVIGLMIAYQIPIIGDITKANNTILERLDFSKKQYGMGNSRINEGDYARRQFELLDGMVRLELPIEENNLSFEYSRLNLNKKVLDAMNSMSLKYGTVHFNGKAMGGYVITKEHVNPYKIHQIYQEIKAVDAKIKTLPKLSEILTS